MAGFKIVCEPMIHTPSRMSEYTTVGISINHWWFRNGTPPGTAHVIARATESGERGDTARSRTEKKTPFSYEPLSRIWPLGLSGP